jgi:hypothetical protein
MAFRRLESYLFPVKADGVVTAKPITLLTSAAVPVKILSGTGAPTIAAPQGSMYLRTDGSSVSTRLYINTTGSTVWTAVTTAA